MLLMIEGMKIVLRIPHHLSLTFDDFFRHADQVLENYVTHTLMDIVNTFFKSPFSEQSTTVQVNAFILLYSFSKILLTFFQ